MSACAHDRIGRAFAAAERDSCCLVPQSDADRRWLQRAARRGEVISPVLGAYARAAYWERLKPPQRMLHRMRTLARQHPEWVFAGTSAALVHGLELGYQDMGAICLAVSAKAHSRSRGGIVRIEVGGDTPVVRMGLRATSFSRTIYDCLRTLPFPAALAIADSALRAKAVTRDRLACNVRRSCAGTRGLRRVLDIIALADGRAENGGESKVRAAIISLGFAVPDLQKEMPDSLDPQKINRVDFAWTLPDGTLVVGELDGKDKYVDPQMTGGRSPEEVLLDERRREAHVTLNSRPVRIMRFSFSEACDPVFFARLLAAYDIPRAVEIPEVARAQGAW